MVDDADRAQEQMERLEYLRQQRTPRPPLPRASDYCIDCDELIEAIRRKALPQTARCILCQQDFEKYEAQYGR